MSFSYRACACVRLCVCICVCVLFQLIDHNTKSQRLILILNTLLYAFFIIIVLVFHFLVRSPQAECGTVSQAAYDKVVRTQQVKKPLFFPTCIVCMYVCVYVRLCVLCMVYCVSCSCVYAYARG